MAYILTVLSIVGSIFLTPYLVLLASILLLASIGQSIGVRRLYVKILLTIFEVRNRIVKYITNFRRLRQYNYLNLNNTHELFFTKPWYPDVFRYV